MSEEIVDSTGTLLPAKHPEPLVSVAHFGRIVKVVAPLIGMTSFSSNRWGPWLDEAEPL
jgi:hypothetical protein